MSRGSLRIYLGAAPGVGKTYAMLSEARRRAERGADVVVAWVETYGRPRTVAQIGALEVIERRTIPDGGPQGEEMDLDAVLARRPMVALVDELAHTNAPGSAHPKRWQDVEELLEAGIDVISTVNIEHLESLADVVADITGTAQQDTIPDGVVRAADQIELIDMSPESLRRRMAHGNIYPAERVDPALAHYFRIGNLSALRELALLWVADRVDEATQQYRDRHGAGRAWETRERVVVALTGSPGAVRIVRRGARMAARGRAELIGVHVRPSGGRTGTETDRLSDHIALLRQLGGRYAEITGPDVAGALVEFARTESATQLLLGSSRRSRWAELTSGSIINDVIRRAGAIVDVHVISAEHPEGQATPSRWLPSSPRRARLARLSARRMAAGWVLAVLGLPGLTLALVPLRDASGPVGLLPELLLGVVVVSVVGGLAPGLIGALLAFGSADWYLVEPHHSLSIARTADASALVSFLVTAAIVSGLIDLLARRNLREARAKREAEALARLARGVVLSRPETLEALVGELRSTFGLDAVTVLRPAGAAAPEEGSDGGSAKAGPGWEVQVAAGRPVAATPDDGSYSAELAGGSVLVITGQQLAAEDRRLLGAFVAQLRLAQEQEQLRQTAEAAEALAAANELRTALLSAVSHDLRTPLASIKAAATSLLSTDVAWPAEVARGFLEGIDADADRLTGLVTNLLDMSRLQTGALRVHPVPVSLDEVAYAALASLSRETAAVTVEVPETLAPVLADPALLERAVANLIANALTWSPPGRSVRVEAGAHGTAVDLRVVDRGPGIPPAQRNEVFKPFQRLGDAHGRAPEGLGLGLAVARGFMEAMEGELLLEDTPGGGLTAVVTLPRAAGSPPARPRPAPARDAAPA